MIQFFVYAGRLISAVALLGLGLIFVALAFSGDNSRAFGLGVAVFLAVVGAFAWPRRPNAWRRDPPTERQIAYARDLGIPIPRGITKGELSDLISEFRRAL